MTAKISVIIPVYNVEKYLRQCLDSVINQTLKDIEIICVDDGSTDGSGAILDEYAANDGRIKVIHKENGGYGKAMNVGMDNARGEYIGIVEPDDYIELDMYETMYNTATNTNVDFVKADYYRFSEDKEHKHIFIDWSEKYYNRVIRTKEEKSFFDMEMNTWTGIYKTEFLRNNNIRYNETPGARYQDQGFWFQTYIYANTIYVIHKPFYHYRYFQTNSSNNPNGFDWIRVEYQYILDILNKHPEIKKEFLSKYTKYKFNNYLFNYNKLNRKQKHEKLKIFREDFINDQKNNGIDISEIDQDLFKLLIEKPNKFYRKITGSLTLCQKLFSIKNQNYHKHIRFLGIKIRIKSQKLEERERLKRIESKLDKLCNKLSEII